jgi:hypothetical protein
MADGPRDRDEREESVACVPGSLVPGPYRSRTAVRVGIPATAVYYTAVHVVRVFRLLQLW